VGERHSAVLLPTSVSAVSRSRHTSHTLLYVLGLYMAKSNIVRHYNVHLKVFASAVMWCPSVRPSRSWILSKRINIKLYSNFFSPSGSHTIHFFRTKRHGNIPTGTFLTGASNAGGVCRNRDNEPISGFIACCQCCNRPGVINMAPPDRGKL